MLFTQRLTHQVLTPSSPSAQDLTSNYMAFPSHFNLRRHLDITSLPGQAPALHLPASGSLSQLLGCQLREEPRPPEPRARTARCCLTRAPQWLLHMGTVHTSFPSLCLGGCRVPPSALRPTPPALAASSGSSPPLPSARKLQPGEHLH